jgi:hypothetical protein
MRLRLVVCVALLGLAGCAYERVTRAPDGREAHVIHCGDLLRGMATCDEMARNLCGARGYDVLAENEEREPIVTVSISGDSATERVSRELMVACKAPPQ